MRTRKAEDVTTTSSRPTRLRNLRDAVLLPALAAALPWAWGFGLLRKFAASSDLYPELTDVACNGAMTVSPISDISEWKRRFRLIRLVDHCDMYLVRTRSRRWFCQHVDVDGTWPKSGPFIAMTFHWGAGLWALADLHSVGIPVRFLSARIDKSQFQGDWVAHTYARCRNRTVQSAGGAPVIYTGGATQSIRDALAQGHVVAALYDIPADKARATLLTKVCGRPVEFPAGLANLAVASGVPVVPFAMGLDYQSGRRQLKIEESFHPASAQDFADRLAESLTRLIRQDTCAWHFSGYAPLFFAAGAAATAAAIDRVRSA
jgi:phosphatidylinositol dimannoside acyltransferase